VFLSTNSGVAAIFGSPVCWCLGGAGTFEISVVVAPGRACTTVGPTGLGGAAKAGFGTRFDLACAALRSARVAPLAVREAAADAGGPRAPAVPACAPAAGLVGLPLRLAVGRRDLLASW
jgi:hypothetical protein